MTFRIQQIVDYGTAHPAVARLTVQMAELMRFYSVASSVQDSVYRTICSEVLPRLMTCYRTHERISSDVEKVKEQIRSRGLDAQANGRAYTIPSVCNLKADSESYLYHAKSALRDFTIVFNTLFNTTFSRQARYGEIVSWAKGKFGDDSPLALMLDNDFRGWISPLVRMRNAVEHPGGHSGTLHIHDFRAVESDGVIILSEPTWHLNEDTPAPLASGMQVFNSNMLTFFEESLLLCLETFPKPPFIRLIEIPEHERRPECPCRFEMGLQP
ncbi:MAG: hypothetical protein IAE97_03095 [Chthoniobacterales bacterium]|nr:hypothetical protein [Chthoniobacterales bacterium]